MKRRGKEEGRPHGVARSIDRCLLCLLGGAQGGGEEEGLELGALVWVF